MECAAKPGCSKLLRRYVMQVVMLGWGIFGISQSPAGMFLAFHHSILGPYYGDNERILQWPHSPLNVTPMALETTFNDKMVEITEKFTKGKITGLSFLDFPGIGNSIGAKYLVLFSSQFLEMREKCISFAQFLYFLREVCLLYNF